MRDTTVSFLGYEMKNPVVPASGTFGFGWEFAEYYDIDILGSMSLKGTTAEARYGNPLPRIAECTAGLINAIGLQNPGVAAVIGEEIPRLDKVYHGKVIANVGGHSVEEYVTTASAFNDCDKVFAVELNISCPNVKGGGMAFGTDAKIAKNLVYEVKKSVTKPLIVKLSPNVTSIADMAKAAVDGGADALSLINTLVGMRIDLKTRRPVISVRTGGFSGPAVSHRRGAPRRDGGARHKFFEGDNRRRERLKTPWQKTSSSHWISPPPRRPSPSSTASGERSASPL